jgi:hypothetical protein
MAYIKQTWVDQEGQVRYSETTDGDYKIFTPNYEEVTTIGTPVNAVNMNHIEDGIEQCYTDFENMIKAIYPVGAIYIGMTETCPISALFGTWTKITSGLTLQQADNVNTVGTEIPAGLPNIEGGISNAYSAGTASGALNKRTNGSGWGGGNEGTVGRGLLLNASWDNSIYGASDTVQPPALAVNIWQRTA